MTERIDYKRYKRAYYARHREKIAEYKRAYYARHREKIAEYKRAYYARHREKIAERGRTYREHNREKIAERGRTYREHNREKIAARERANRLGERPLPDLDWAVCARGGTVAQARAHWRRGEKPCAACLRAHAEYQANRRLARAAAASS